MDNITVKLQKGLIYANQGRTRDAENYFLKLLRENPDNALILSTWAEFAEIGVNGLEILNISGIELTIDMNMDKYVDKWFDQIINGEISISEISTMIRNFASNGYFSKETEDYIFNKWLLLYTERNFDWKNDAGSEWPYPPVGDWESGLHGDGIGVNNSYGMQFEMDGSVYVISKGSKNGSQSFMSSDILKYTTNTNLINQFFDIAATKDGQPYIYRLKEGMSLDEFKRIANPSLSKRDEALTYLQTIDADALGDKKQEFLEKAIFIVEKYAKNRMDFSTFKLQIQALYDFYKNNDPEDSFIKLFTYAYHNKKRDEYYRIFINNYDALGSFDMQSVYVNNRGQYVSTSNPSRGLCSNLFDTVKALINDIPLGNLVLESIGGDDRLREIIMNIWNSYAPQSNMDIEWLFNDIFDSIFSTYGELESYMNT